MPLARILIAALLFLAWMPATSSCLLVAAFPGDFSDCCREESGEESSACDQCVTLENGFQLSQLQQFTVATPEFVESAWLSGILRTMTREACEVPHCPAREAPPPIERLWTFVARTALPVRGPSLAA